MFAKFYHLYSALWPRGLGRESKRCSRASWTMGNRDSVVVSSQSDVGGNDVYRPAMFRRQLSNRREVVETLDSESVFGYLIQNGVLEEEQAEEIKKERSSALVNLALLKHLEDHGNSAVELLINALRTTGQHHLASLLDEGYRIKPPSGSGYLSKTRHKGQVGVQISVKAVKLPAKEVYSQYHANKRFKDSQREWLSVDDIKPIRTESIPLEVLDLVEPGQGDEEEEEGKSRTCLCLCFSKMFRKDKNKERKKGKQYRQNNEPYAKSNNGNSSKNENGTSSEEQVKNDKNVSKPINGISSKADIYAQFSKTDNLKLQNINDNDETQFDLEEQLRTNAMILEEKSENFYNALTDHESECHQKLLRYFEQERGMLVLETTVNESLMVVNICMKLTQLEELRRDYRSGKLGHDLETCIITEGLLEVVNVRGIKLQVDLEQEELELVEQELC